MLDENLWKFNYQTIKFLLFYMHKISLFLILFDIKKIMYGKRRENQTTFHKDEI
jgi:hypothetical protein